MWAYHGMAADSAGRKPHIARSDQMVNTAYISVIAALAGLTVMLFNRPLNAMLRE